MPKVKRLGVPDRQREIEAVLWERYGGSLTIGNLCDYLNTKERRTASKFADGLPYFKVGTRKRWHSEDVARKLYENEICT